MFYVILGAIILLALIAITLYLFRMLDKDIYIHEVQLKVFRIHIKITTKTKDEPPNKVVRPNKDIKNN